MRPASVSDRDREISRARLSEVKSGEEEEGGRGGGLHRKRKVDMKCCIAFILYKVVFFLNNVFYHELKCSDSCSHLSDGKTKSLLKNFNHEYAV